MADTSTLSGDAQQAMYAVLSADAVLMSQVKGILDDVPDEQTFPYVGFGPSTETEQDTFGTNGGEITLTLDIWSRALGFAEALSIAGDLRRLLHRQALPLSAHTFIHCLIDDVATLRDPDGITRHVPVRFRIMAQDT